MQKLVFRNANNVEVDLTSGNFGITEWEGFSNTELNIQSQQVPFHDGSVYLDGLLGERELNVTLAIDDEKDLEKRYELRRQLIEILNPKLGEGTLIYTNDFISKQIKAVPQLPVFENHNANDSGTPKAGLSWICPSPYWEDTEETVININSNNNSADNNGDYSCSLEILLKTDYIKNPIIRNMTTKKFIQLEGDFSNSIHIDTEFGNKNVLSNELILNWKTGGEFNDIIFNGEKYIFVGDIFLNLDVYGNSFCSRKPIISDLTSIWKSIGYGNEKYIVAGESKSFAKSVDEGVTWQPIDLSSILVYDNDAINRIRYLNGKWFAVGRSGLTGNGGLILTSTDGENWTRKEEFSSPLHNTEFFDIKYINNKYWLCSTAYLYSSTDGEDWTQIYNLGNFYLNCIDYFKNKYYISAECISPNDSTLGKICVSSNGIDWQEISFENYLYNLAHNENEIIVTSSNGKNFSSNDGENWESLDVSNIAGDLKQINYANNQFTLCGYGGSICILQNHIPQTINIGINGDFLDIERFNNQFYTVGGRDGRASIFISSDLVNWNYYSFNNIYDNFQSIYSAFNKLYIGGKNIMLTSTDGENWTDSSLTGVITQFLFFNNILYRVVRNNLNYSIQESTDGENWTDSSLIGNSLIIVNNEIIATSMRTCCYGKGIFVGSDGFYLYSSTDGENWIKANINSYYSPNRVYFQDDNFWAVCDRGILLNSNNGKYWKMISNFTTSELWCLAVNEDDVYVLGTKGIVMKSEYSDFENLIATLSENSDMNLSLQKGTNILKLNYDEGEGELQIIYRQKYVGV